MTRSWRSVVGLTLMEVLIAVAIVGLALLAWTKLQGGLARVEHANHARRELAAWMRSELRVQRNVRALTCRSREAPAGWSCAVTRTCMRGPSPCEIEVVHVTIRPASGPPLTGSTAVWWPLQRAPVEVPP